jgi:hypothetical protein
MPTTTAAEDKLVLKRMLLDMSFITMKFLTAYYIRSLLLASDALFGIFIWLRFLAARRNRVPANSFVAITLGMFFAAAAAGVAWSSLGSVLALFQGLEFAVPGRITLVAAVLLLVLRDLFIRFFPVQLGNGKEELFFERTVSGLTLAVMALSLASGLLGLAAPLFTLGLSLGTACFSGKVIFDEVEYLLSSRHSES